MAVWFAVSVSIPLSCSAVNGIPAVTPEAVTSVTTPDATTSVTSLSVTVTVPAAVPLTPVSMPAFSVKLAAAAVSTGASLVPVMVMVTVCSLEVLTSPPFA